MRRSEPSSPIQARADVGAYRERFDCAVSTARDDLNRLVDLRYCSAAYQGKKQVFWLNGLSRWRLLPQPPVGRPWQQPPYG